MQQLKLTPKISLLINKNFPACNSLLIEDSQTAIIDSGLGSKWLKKLFAEKNIDILINSHTHPDHVAGNALVMRLSGVEIYAPYQERGYNLSLEKMKKDLGVKGSSIQGSWEIFVRDQIGFQEIEKETTFNDAHIFDLGDVQLEAIHIPGHSPGHFGFLIREDNIFFASDIGLDLFGPWYGYGNSDLDVFISSIHKIKGLDIERTVSSHSDQLIDDINKGLDGCLRIIDQRNNRILDKINQGVKDIKKLVGSGFIYKSLSSRIMSPDFVSFFEEKMIKEHIKILISAGEVDKEVFYTCF